MVRLLLVFATLLSALFFEKPIAESEKNCFAVARLKYGGGGDWYAGSSMLVNLQSRIKKDLNLDACTGEHVIGLLDPDLYRYPILFMTGHGNVAFSEEERRVLRRYLLKGGFLFADDNYGLEPSFRREMGLLFPQLPWVALPSTHPIFHSHYDFPDGLPKIHQHDGKPATAYGITYSGKLLVLFTYECDLGNGWEDLGTYPDPPEKHEQALKMGVNVIAYFMQGTLSP